MYKPNALLKMYFKSFAKYFSDIGTSNNSEEQYSTIVYTHIYMLKNITFNMPQNNHSIIVRNKGIH